MSDSHGIAFVTLSGMDAGNGGRANLNAANNSDGDKEVIREELRNFVSITANIAETSEGRINLKTGDVNDEERGRMLFFNDGVRRIDYILVWVHRDRKSGKEEEKMNIRRTFEMNLEAEGLELERDVQEGREYQFTKIHAPFEVLTRYAEIMKIRMPIIHHPTEAQSHGLLLDQMECCMKGLLRPCSLDVDKVPAMPKVFTCVYERAKDYLFAIPPDKDNFFSHGTRNNIVDYILRHKSYSRDKEEVFNFAHMESGIKRLLADKVYLSAYPLHEGSWQPESKRSMRRLLYTQWASWRAWSKMQPLDYIRSYFGAKIGFYFAWLGYYTYWLLAPSLFGLVVFIYGVATFGDDIISREACDPSNNFTMCPMCIRHCGYWSFHQICLYLRIARAFDNELTFFFAIFMSLWGTLYLEFWKRQQAGITYRWNLNNFQEELEPPRPEYLVQLSNSRYTKTQRASEELQEQPYLPFWRRQVPIYAVSGIFVLFLCLCVLAVIIGIVFYRMSLLTALYLTDEPIIYKNAAIVVTVTSAIINLICIFAINFVYTRLAIMLTNWECQRTQTEYDNSLVVKLYVLQFVNYYSSLFYIAFFKGRLVGSPAKYQTFAGARQEECQGGCLIDLCIQLAIIFVGKQLIQNNLMEIFVPRLKLWLKKCLTKMDTVRLRDQSPWQQDFLLEEIGPMGLFNEYLEMMLQFGFVTLFVAAFPLAPFFAYINNVIEIRADANKFVTQLRRPKASRASGIGIWFDVLFGLSRLAIFTNALIIAFTSQFIDRLVYRTLYSETGTLEGFVNNTMSYFNVSDFPPLMGPAPNEITAQHNETEICRYLDYRHPPWSEHKYTYTAQHWNILAAKFAFVVFFENFVILVTSLVAYVIPDMPSKLRKQASDESSFTNEMIIKAELLRANRWNGRLMSPEVEAIRRRAVDKLVMEDGGGVPAARFTGDAATAAQDDGAANDAEMLGLLHRQILSEPDKSVL